MKLSDWILTNSSGSILTSILAVFLYILPILWYSSVIFGDLCIVKSPQKEASVRRANKSG